jgi:hypothetical protein
MKSIMKTITIYRYSELSEQAQNHVLESSEHDQIKEQLWNTAETELIEEVLRPKLTAQGLMDVDIRYTGFWSQGDGLSFTAEVSDPETFCQAIGMDYKPQLWSGIGLEIVRGQSRYLHERTCSIRIESSESESHELSRYLFTLENRAEAWRLEQCQDMYRTLERAYYAATGYESVHGVLLEDEEELYLEDGNRV